MWRVDPIVLLFDHGDFWEVIHVLLPCFINHALLPICLEFVMVGAHSLKKRTPFPLCYTREVCCEDLVKLV
jgi:hypothetical protein